MDAGFDVIYQVNCTLDPSNDKARKIVAGALAKIAIHHDVKMMACRKINKTGIAITHLLWTFFILISTCCSSQLKRATAEKDAAFNEEKVLIVYLSRTNNTKAIAEIIQNYVGGKLVALELKDPYPANYRTTVQQVVKENETGYLPKLKTKIDGIEKYEVIFIGFPTWDMKMPPPVKSFLRQYNFTGKTIIPFNTHAGYGTGSGFQSVRELCKHSNVLEGFEIKGGVERDGEYHAIENQRAREAKAEVEKWLKKIKLIREVPN